MIRRAARAAVALAAVSVAAWVLTPRQAGAQVPTRRPTPARPARDSQTVTRDTVRAGARRDSTGTARDTVRARGDSVRAAGDSSRGPRTLITWRETDSVMTALAARKGFRVTRYQGDTVIFRTQEHTLQLGGKPSGVQRDETVLVGTRILFNDSTQILQARGDTVILRDPQRSTEDLVASGTIKFSIPESRGVVTNLTTRIENNGNMWTLFGHEAAVQNYEDSTALAAGDTAGAKRSAFYAHGGIITSCDETEPHFHFSTAELKVVSNRVMVGRPAVLYIGEVPIAWIPFFFQDMRKGRRSGLLTPRFGFSEFIRQGAGYRRTLENFGWYFNLGDYFDAQIALDWRSSANSTNGGPGWTTLRGGLRYSWFSRFIDGSIGLQQQTLSDGSGQRSIAWTHSQRFNQKSSFNVNWRYSSNTQVLRNTTFDPRVALGLIASQANYTNAFGPVSLSLGGTQTQYPGRPQLDRTFPTLSLTSRPVTLIDSVTWTPAFQVSTSQSLNAPGGEFPWRYTRNAAGAADSVPGFQNTRNTTGSFDTPIKIYNFVWRNSFRFGDQLRDYAQTLQYRGVRDTSINFTRTVAQYFETTLDWDTGINLPQFARGTWNITPSISLANVDGGAFAVRTTRSNGAWVRQNKRLLYGLSVAPTLFGIFPGFGPVSRIRHSLNPTLSFTYAPAADISDEYLEAVGRTRVGDRASIQQSAINLGVSQNIEIKLRGSVDSTGLEADGKKVRLLSLQTSSFAYNYELYRVRKRDAAAAGLPAPSWVRGLETNAFNFTLRSDLLPGFDLGMNWSLFQGDVRNDTATFSPYRDQVRFSLSLDPSNPIVSVARRWLGLGPASAVGSAGTAQRQQMPQQADAFSGRAGMGPATPAQQLIPSGQGWRASVSFSSNRTRPVRGGPSVPVIDPRQACRIFLPNIFAYDQCVTNPATLATTLPPASTSVGFVQPQQPPVTNATWNMGFNLTPKWSAQWNTSYDFVAKQFAQQVVTFQRELHDWRANFSFTQGPNGNVFFNFLISLKSEPNLKFNYDRRTQGSTF